LALLALLASPAAAQDAIPADFVYAGTVVPPLVVEMRYFGTNNFVGRT